MRRSDIQRTEWKRKPVTKSAALARVASKEGKAVDKVRRTLTQSRPKMTPIRKAARNQECTLQFPGICNRDPATTVLCHSNSLADGKGIGLKAPDEKACFGCSACHDVLDGRRPRPTGLTYDAMQKKFYHAVECTHEVLRPLGLLKNGTGTGATAPAPEQISLEQ